MANVFNGILRLRRDNDYNYARIENTFIPANGEVCLVDTARMGLRAKVGNGTDVWKNLAYSDEFLINQINNIVEKGYLHDGEFYEDSQYTILLDKSISKIYINKENNQIYHFDGIEYTLLEGNLPIASSMTAGIMKLYDNTGTNIDGTMTQRAITDELNDKIEMIVAPETETIIFGYDIVDR